MTLFDAYLNYKRKRKEIEDDFRVRIREAGTPAPEILMELSNSFLEAKEIADFVRYTHEKPLTIRPLLKYLSEMTGQKWSCTAKLTNYVPEHIENELKNEKPQIRPITMEILDQMRNHAFFELYFHTTINNPETDEEASFVKSFTISTDSPYEKLKKQKDLLDNLNFYECLLDDYFKNSNAVWAICPDKESQTFLPNVVKNYIRTVQFAENTNEKEK